MRKVFGIKIKKKSRHAIIPHCSINVRAEFHVIHLTVKYFPLLCVNICTGANIRLFCSPVYLNTTTGQRFVLGRDRSINEYILRT